MNNNMGFSLVELMVAVGIVGVMSSVAVPKYQKYKVNASRAEAQSSLSSMYTLQQLYYTENDKYGAVKADNTINDVKFPISKSQKYDYNALIGTALNVVAITKDDGAGNTDGSVFFKGTAESKQVLGSCSGNGTPVKDKWCVNHDRVLANIPTEAKPPCNVTPGTGDAVNGGCS